jgi:hypothetical protein
LERPKEKLKPDLYDHLVADKAAASSALISVNAATSQRTKEEAAAAVKRGRGRPRKDGQPSRPAVAAPAAGAGQTRGRGRPRKEIGAARNVAASSDLKTAPGRSVVSVKTKPESEQYHKIFVLVITDVASRASHFEYTYGQTTKEFLNALKRYFGRRGLCETMTCDNSKTFIKADLEISRLYNSLDMVLVQRELASLPTPVDFRFNPPLAPHTGGIFERVVQGLKRSLRATLGRRRVDLEEFRTCLVTAEAQWNSRPLTATSDDPRDPGAITPAHLVNGRALNQLPEALARDDLTTKSALRWRQMTDLQREFTSRWRTEYLANLNSFQKWHVVKLGPKEGEIVLIQGPSKNKLTWPLGRIEKVTLGRDGLVRSVLLHTQSGPMRRDLRSLCRLEEPTDDQQRIFQQERLRQLEEKKLAKKAVAKNGGGAPATTLPAAEGAAGQ